MQHPTPQAGLNNDRVLFSHGHTLGGGSARNFMWYERGTKTVYNQWANITGDISWAWDAFLPFLKSPVNFTAPETFVSVPPSQNSDPGKVASRPGQKSPAFDENDYDKDGSPLHVSYPLFLVPSGAYMGAGLSELGLKQLPGMVNGDLLAWMSCATTIDPETRTRSTSETSMLRQAIQRNFSLQVFTQTPAKKILFDKKRAYGIDVEVQGVGSGKVNFHINATKEVIVSAGAFRSPQLLMVSGIGPKHTLADNGIEVVSEMEGVGQNMMDHIWTAITREVDVVTIAALADPEFASQQNAEYIANRTGIGKLTERKRNT
jgi:choline dehydrogenase-like flavoprotein